MNHNHLYRRLAAVLAGLITAMVTVTAISSAAFASNLPLPGGGSAGGTPPEIRTVVVGGTPGWQITLIAAGAAALAAGLAVIADRARAYRRHVAASAT